MLLPARQAARSQGVSDSTLVADLRIAELLIALDRRPEARDVLDELDLELTRLGHGTSLLTDESARIRAAL